MNKYSVTVHPYVSKKIVYKIDAVTKEEAADIAREMAKSRCYFSCTTKNVRLLKK